jgi:hypothetical protein
LHAERLSLLHGLDANAIYDDNGHGPGESLLRSASAVEQLAGGITVRLWDDPFEWTLPEQLSTKEKISEHFDVVEASRLRAFAHLKDDSDLEKLIPAPEELRPLGDVISDALALSISHLERAAELTAHDI